MCFSILKTHPLKFDGLKDGSYAPRKGLLIMNVTDRKDNVKHLINADGSLNYNPVPPEPPLHKGSAPSPILNMQRGWAIDCLRNRDRLSDNDRRWLRGIVIRVVLSEGPELTAGEHEELRAMAARFWPIREDGIRISPRGEVTR